MYVREREKVRQRDRETDIEIFRKTSLKSEKADYYIIILILDKSYAQIVILRCVGV